MSLIKCKGCGQKISKQAKSCPGCGAPAAKTSRSVKLLIVFVALAAISAYIVQPSADRPKVELSQQDKERIEQEAEARVAKSRDVRLEIAAEKAVRSLLKDPDSAKFSMVRVAESQATGRVVCGVVNAKNSFGAMAGDQRFVSNGKTTFMEGDASFTSAWQAVCL